MTETRALAEALAAAMKTLWDVPDYLDADGTDNGWPVVADALVQVIAANPSAKAALRAWLGLDVQRLARAEPLTEAGRAQTPLITRSADHTYTFEGRQYPGVTGVLKVLDKSDALIGWASRKTAEAAIANLDSLPALLESVGAEGVIKALTARSSWTSQKAMDLGSEIHDLADRYVRGEALPAVVSAEALRRVQMYAEWWQASGWRVRSSEALLIQPDMGYGGTLDLLCYDRDGRTVLADIKSGRIDYRGRVYDSIVLQLAAYTEAKYLQHEGVVYPMPRVDRHAVIHVTEEGVREVEVNVGRADKQAFLFCLGLHEWRSSKHT